MPIESHISSAYVVNNLKYDYRSILSITSFYYYVSIKSLYAVILSPFLFFLFPSVILTADVTHVQLNTP